MFLAHSHSEAHRGLFGDAKAARVCSFIAVVAQRLFFVCPVTTLAMLAPWYAWQLKRR